MATLLRTLACCGRRGLPRAPAGRGRKTAWSLAAEGGAAGRGRGRPVSRPGGRHVPYYAAADVYVHPTIYDTCSLVVLEAAACGLPVVTTRCNGAAELFHDGDDILLVADPADDETFAAAVEGLLDPAAHRAIGDAARRTATANTFDRNVGQHPGAVRGGRPKRGRLAGRRGVGPGRSSPRARRRGGPALRRGLPRQVRLDTGASR